MPNSEATLLRPFPFLTLHFRTLLRLFIYIDIAFILVNVLDVLAYDADLIALVPPEMKITEDRSLPEMFNYLKWLVISVALIWVSIRDRWLAPALWAVVFAMILIDDSLQVHENFGDWLSASGTTEDGTLLQGTHLGELAAFSGMGMITLVILAILFTRKDRATRDMTWRYFFVVLALGFFAVGLDAVHSVVTHLSGTSSLAVLLQQAFGLFEDGGEMIVGSVAVALTLAPDTSNFTS